MKRPLICPYCNKTAVWCENKEIYGRNYGNSYMCWLCKDCNAYVGCHNNGKTALGTIANKELREYRRKVHERIDPMWKGGLITRKELYKKLNILIGREYHTGEADLELCKKILGLFPENKFIRPTLESIKSIYEKALS